MTLETGSLLDMVLPLHHPPNEWAIICLACAYTVSYMGKAAETQ